MRITSPEGNRFELKIVGYQFPDIKNDYWDSNWLRIKVDVRKGRKTWSAVDACLLTFEIAWLTTWLENVQANTEKDFACSFIEPNLEFCVVENEVGKKQLRIFFELIFRPPVEYSDIAGLKDFWIDFDLETLDLIQLARELHLQLQKYPQRVFEH